MKNGFISILKPSGMNSNYAVVGVRHLFEKGTKVGHMGTLDPAAAGVLPVGIGFGARLFNYIIDKEKEYICELMLGVTTDTQDAEGRILEKHSVDVPRDQLQEILAQFTGDILQTPPAYSAVMKDGQKLYAIARSGGDTTVAQRPAHIDTLEILQQLTPARYLLRVVCGRGTYIRTLCHDIGQALGCGAICSFLLRTKTGAFCLENSVILEDLKAEPEKITLLPVDFPIMHMQKAVLSGALRQQVRNGAPIRWNKVTSDVSVGCQEPLRVYLEDRFVGIGQRRENQLRFLSLMPPEEFDV